MQKADRTAVVAVLVLFVVISMQLRADQECFRTTAMITAMHSLCKNYRASFVRTMQHREVPHSYRYSYCVKAPIVQSVMYIHLNVYVIQHVIAVSCLFSVCNQYCLSVGNFHTNNFCRWSHWSHHLDYLSTKPAGGRRR